MDNNMYFKEFSFKIKITGTNLKTTRRYEWAIVIGNGVSPKYGLRRVTHIIKYDDGEIDYVPMDELDSYVMEPIEE